MDFKAKLRFIVTSDIHYKIDTDVEKERFEKGMLDAYKYAEEQSYKNIDAFFAVGDFANRGQADEMLKFKESLDKVIRPETKITLMLASHEFMSEGQEAAREKLKSIYGYEPDNHFELNGCNFICISTEDGCRIKEQKQDWLKEKLAASVKNGRKAPIFVFQHPHLTDTVYGSINWGEDDIIAILNDYPQVIDFSGHSHAPINDPRSIHQKYITSLNTGSLSYFELDEFDLMYGTVPPDAKQCAQFYIVEVNEENAVRILSYDILTERFFDNEYIIETPWDPESFVYTPERALTEPKPYFSDDTVCIISTENGKLTAEFTQAKTDGYRVNAYTLAVRNSDGEIILQKRVTSSYYLNDMPEKMSVSFDFPFDAGEYTLEITAHGFWIVKSDKFVFRFSV